MRIELPPDYSPQRNPEGCAALLSSDFAHCAALLMSAATASLILLVEYDRIGWIAARGVASLVRRSYGGSAMAKDASSGSDRRKAPRVKMSFPVTYSFEEPSTKCTIMGDAQAVNVSSEGICLECDSPAVLLHGAPMDVAMEFPGGTSAILAKGLVQWSKASNGGSHIGVMIVFTGDKRRLRWSIYGSNGADKEDS